MTTSLPDVRARAEDVSPAEVGRRFWLAERSALPVDIFRTAAGIALGAHLLRHLIESPALLAMAGPGGISGGHALRSSSLADGLPADTLRWIVAAGFVPVAGIVAGFLPQICAAALYTLFIALFWALYPAVGFDDYLANVTTLFLIILPAGDRLTWTAISSRTLGRSRVPGLVVSLFLAHTTFIYVTNGCGNLVASGQAIDRYVVLALMAIPVLFILPGMALAGVLVQISVHGYLLTTTHDVFPHLLFASTSLLFWGEVPHGSDKVVIDAPGAVGLVAATVWAVGAASTVLGPIPWTNRIAGVLVDTGTLLVRHPGIEFELVTKPHESPPEEADPLILASPRARALAEGIFEAHMISQKDDRDRLALDLVSLCCQSETEERDLLLRIQLRNEPLVRYRCESYGRAGLVPDSP